MTVQDNATRLYWYLLAQYRPIKSELVAESLHITPRELRAARQEIAENDQYDYKIDFNEEGIFLTTGNDLQRLELRLRNQFKRTWKQYKEVLRIMNNTNQINLVEILEDIDNDKPTCQCGKPIYKKGHCFQCWSELILSDEERYDE